MIQLWESWSIRVLLKLRNADIFRKLYNKAQGAFLQEKYTKFSLKADRWMLWCLMEMRLFILTTMDAFMELDKDPDQSWILYKLGLFKCSKLWSSKFRNRSTHHSYRDWRKRILKISLKILSILACHLYPKMDLHLREIKNSESVNLLWNIERNTIWQLFRKLWSCGNKDIQKFLS